MNNLLAELGAGFTAGNFAILSNVCMLPLYPGLIAFLAGSAQNERSRRATGWLGVIVLAGILSMMLLIGLLLYLLNASFGSILTILLPLIYLLVIVMGVLMLTGRSPFARLAMAQAPVLRNPYATAYIYGLMFAPMTLPCTGPIILGVFLLGANNAAQLVDGLLYFLAFGLGFGWPLVLLPLLALPLQRRFISWLTRHHLLLERVSGVLLISVGLFGILTELIPNWFAAQRIEISPTIVTLFWLVALLVALVVGYITWRGQNPPKQQPN